MFSLKNLALLALAALVPAALAAPTTPANILARCGCSSGPTIVADLSAAVSVHVSELRFLTRANATVDVITPIVGEIKAAISASIVEVQGLVGQPAEIVLATVDGAAQVTVQELCQLIATLFIDIFGALGFVLSLGGLGAYAAIVALLSTVGEVLGCWFCCFVSATGGVVDGLVVTVLGLIGSVVTVILQLKITMLISVLGLTL